MATTALAAALPSGLASAMVNPATISGVVVDTNNQPLPNISVQLQPVSAASTCNATVTTNASGQFNLADVPAGTYRLVFNDPQHTYINPSYYPSTTAIGSATQLTVMAGQILSNLTQTLTLGGTISGIVSGPSGPLSGAFVFASQSTGGGAGVSATTAANGTYTLTGLGTGSVTVQFNQPYNANLVQQSVSTNATASQATTGVDATLQPGGTIFGSVIDANGHGISNISVLAFPTTNTPGIIPSTVSLSPAGNFNLTGLSGSNSLEFIDTLNGDYAWQFSGGGTTLSGATPVTVTPGVISYYTATLTPAGKISGTVSDSAGNGLSNVYVTSLLSSAGATTSTRSGSGGAYTLGGLPTGTFKLGYQPPNAPSFGFVFYKNTGLYQDATPVSVTAGSTTTGIDEQITNAASCAASAVNLVSSVNPAVVGQSVTLTATVTDPAASGTPTGTVVFKDGSVTIASVPVNASGVATFTAAASVIGSHTVTASYSGDPSYAPATSAPLTQLVDIDSSSTTLTSSANPSIAGQSVTLTATVTPGSGTSGTPGGGVTFSTGSTTLGSVQLDSTGNAQLTLTGLAVGTPVIIASYGGDTNHASSVSNLLTQTVTKVPSSLSLTTAPNPVLSGNSVTLSATLFHSGLASTTIPPTGSIDFLDGTTSLGSVAVSGNAQTMAATASLVVSNFAPGVHQLTASYAGDSRYTSATSNSVSESVQLQPTVTLTSSLNPAFAPETVNLLVSVTGPSGAPAAPSGTVSLFDDSNPVSIGSGPIDRSGRAVIPVSGLSIATHQLVARYGGDTLYTTGSSSSLSEQIVAAPTNASVNASADPVTVGSPVTLTAQVASPGCPLCGAPGGTVTFMDGTTALGSPVQLQNGQAALTTSSLSVGPHTISVVYTGAAGFGGSSSPGYSLTIVPPAPGLQVTVTDGSGTPIAGANVFTPGGPQATTDSNGQALLSGLADGSYSVDAALQSGGGYEVGQAGGTVTGGAGKVTVVIQPNQVVQATVTATQMTLAQMETAGININDPANSYTVQFVLHLSFDSSSGPVSLDLCGYANQTSLVSASASAYTCGNPLAPGSTSYSAGGENFSFGIGGWGGGGGSGSGSPAPSLEMLETPGVSVLKMFFHVDMTILSLSPSGFSLDSGQASLSVPSGMSLANGESATQAVPAIPGGQSAHVDWIVRGDTPGDYSLTASYGGLLQPLGWPVNVRATTAHPIHVYGPEALKMIVKADSGLYSHLPYRVEIGLQNLVDVPMYDARVLLAPPTSTASYIFQPLQTLGYSTAEIDPGQTWWTGTYELLSPNSGTLNLSQSFVEEMSGAQTMQSTIQSQAPLFTPQTAPTLTATATATGVHLAWSAIQRATSYEVFSTPSDTTAFGATPLTTASGSATSADIPNSGASSWYAVSALVNGVWTMEAAMVRASGAGSKGPGGNGGPTLTASIASPLVYRSVMLTASGFPSDSTVSFAVTSGPDRDTFSGSDWNGLDGTASTEIVGRFLGVDKVVAWVDSNFNGKIDKGEPSATTTVTWTDPKLSDTSCRGDVALIRVRGSGDPRVTAPDLYSRARPVGDSGKQLTLDAAAIGFRQVAEGLGYTVNEYDLKYPAASTSVILQDVLHGRIFSSKYMDSVHQGEQNLSTVLQAKQVCKDQYIFLMGYSQGALVAGNVLTSLSTSQASKIGGVVLFGDPRFDPQDVAAAGGFDSTRHGIAVPVPYGSVRPIGSDYAARSWDVCHSDDLICQGLDPGISAALALGKTSLAQTTFENQKNQHARGYACGGISTDGPCRHYVDQVLPSMAGTYGADLAELLPFRS